MTIRVEQRQLATDEGLLEITYRSINAIKKKLEKFSYIIQNNTVTFGISQTWFNEIPVKGQKGFKAQIFQADSIKAKIVEGNLYLALDLSDSIEVRVANRDDVYSFHVTSHLQVAGLHRLIERRYEISDFNLHDLRGTPLNKSFSLAMYNIGSGATLVLLPVEDLKAKIYKENSKKTTGNEFMPVTFVNPSKSNEFTEPFVKKAPRWRQMPRGLSLIGKCANFTVCDAAKTKDDIYIALPFGEHRMNVIRTEVRCPECKEQTVDEIKNCAFWDCFFSFHGTINKVPYPNSEKRRAPANEYLSFKLVDDNQESTLVEWDSLTIKVWKVSFLTTWFG